MPETDAIAVATPGADAAASSPAPSSTAVAEIPGAETAAPGTAEAEAPETATAEQPEESVAAESPEEEELREYNLSVSARLRELAKQSPSLAQALKENPKLRDTLAGTFRREEAYRDSIGTVAEARQLAELFPRGIADAQHAVTELQELSQLDQFYYSTDSRDHEQFIRNLHKSDPSALRAVLASIPRVWSEIDPAGFGQAFSPIMGQTLRDEKLPAFAQTLVQAAQSGDLDTVRNLAGQLDRWIATFLPQESARLDPREQELARRQKEIDDRDRNWKNEQAVTFHKGWETAEVSQQKELITKLVGAKLQAFSEDKRNRIIEQVRDRVTSYLGKSHSFMRTLESALQGREQSKALEMTKAAWTRILPSVVRRVLNEETPQIVQANRQAVANKRAAAARTDVGAGAPPSGGPKAGSIDKDKLDGMDYFEKIKYLTRQ